MIQVNSRLLLNGPFLRQLDEATVTALEQTAEAVRSEVVQAQVMPRDTGVLQNESTHTQPLQAGESRTSRYEDGTIVINSITNEKNGTVSIVTAAPQARRLYFHPEYDFQTHENPNAKGFWFEDWEPGGAHEDFAPEAFKELYRRLTGV